MSGVVEISLLKANLVGAKATTRKPPHCHLINSKDYRNDKGLVYLVKNVLEPACRGSDISTGDIDFSEFDCSDISELRDFYERNCFSCKCDIENLYNLYNTCIDAIPETVKVDFL